MNLTLKWPWHNLVTIPYTVIVKEPDIQLLEQISSFYQSDFEPMTLILKLHPDMVKMLSRHSKASADLGGRAGLKAPVSEVYAPPPNGKSWIRHWKVISSFDIHKQYENITILYTHVVTTIRLSWFVNPDQTLLYYCNTCMCCLSDFWRVNEVKMSGIQLLCCQNTSRNPFFRREIVIVCYAKIP